MTELLGSEYYDKDYFDNPKTKKSNYGRMSGGYTEEVYRPFKNHQAIKIMQQLGYTARWKPDNVIIAGCAKGFMVRAFQLLGVKCEGFDISEYAIEESKKYTENCKVGNVVDMPQYKDEEFEVSVAMELLEHIPSDEPEKYLSKALDELCRITKLYIVISTPAGDDQDNHDKSKEEGGDPSHFSVYPPDWWKLQFAKRNFIEQTSFVSQDKEKNFFLVVKRT